MEPSPHVARSVEQTIEVGVSRSGTAAAWTPADLPKNRLVELDFGDGISLFTRSDDVGDQIGAIAHRSGGTAYALNRVVADGGATRGESDPLAALTLRRIKLLKTGIGDWLAGKAADVIVGSTAQKVSGLIDGRAVEGRGDKLGVYRCNERTPYAERSDTIRHAGHEPVMLMLHGFISNSIGSFGGLWAREGASTLDALRRHYNEALYCYDHATVGTDPMSNALALAKTFPEGARLHLLAYSRGGLIGETLSQAAAIGAGASISSAQWRKAEQREEAERAVAGMIELAKLLRERDVRIERFVRVACPVRGTWLASNRLDRWLSIVYNVARYAIPVGARSVADSVFDLLAAIVEKRLDADHFPGIASMNPSGPLMALLNDRPPVLDQRLTVVAGDCVADGVFNRLKLLVADGFFGERHDLVVPTASMFGGAMRKGGMRYFFHQAARTNHFAYFDNFESLKRVKIGLIGSDAEYATLQTLETPSARPALVANRAGQDRALLKRAIAANAPLNVLLPGIMGSTLQRSGDDKLWFDASEIVVGNFALLGMDDKQQIAPYPPPGSGGIYPGKPLDYWPVNAYGNLIEYLRNIREAVLPFAYDWRKPIEIAADALAAQLAAAWPKDSPRPLRIVAHSMGGLVARAMFHRHPDLLQRFSASERNRLLMMGTPNGGSYAIVKTLLGDNNLIDFLGCIAPQNRTSLLSTAGTMPGFLELLPQQDGRDWSSPDTWRWLFETHAIADKKRPKIDATASERARAGRNALIQAKTSLPIKNTVYVAGYVPANRKGATIVGIDANGQYVLGDGDGTVSYALGTVEGVETYYVDAAHGDIPDYQPAFSAYRDLLEYGKTALLPKHYAAYEKKPRSLSLSDLDEETVPYRPNAEEIARAWLGMRAPATGAIVADLREADPIELDVVHSSLRFARHAILVGHYQGDAMFGSERDLDRMFDGRLQRALDLGVYPGRIDEFEVFERSQPTHDKRSPFAVVIGLGRPGELSVGQLRNAVCRGLLGWFGTASSERASQSIERSEAPVYFSTVLIGSTASGMSVGECVRAVLQGVHDAQRKLAIDHASAGKLGRIRGIELIEMYEDKALELAYELQSLIASREFSGKFILKNDLDVRDGGLIRLRDESRKANTVRRLDIRAYKGGRLRFALPGIQAAVPLLKRDIDMAEIHAYSRYSEENGTQDKAIGRVLFNQLLPLELKRFALEQYDLVLNLNPAATAIPWELSDSGDGGPLSVQSGMLRQLQSSRYTARERVAEDMALVIGEPQVEGLAPLPSARHEAAAVTAALREAGFTVEYLEHPTAMEVRDALSRHRYRIVHLAGHGLVDYRAPTDDKDARATGSEATILGKPRTGMVIGSLPTKSGSALATNRTRGGSDERSGSDTHAQHATAWHWLLLTPEDIKECMLQVPELVFINCCHLGKIESLSRERPVLASSLARQFMDMGCRAVVAAGWAIEDAAAAAFAAEFYRKLAGEGAFYINAVRDARQATYQDYGDSSWTWGAYQCYGDPRYSARRSSYSNETPTFKLARELNHWLSKVANEAIGATADDAAASCDKIGGMLSRCPSEWRREPDVLQEALAAYDALGGYDAGLALIDECVRAQRSLPLETRSIHARMRLRTAMLARAQNSAHASALQTAAYRSLKDLKALADFGDQPKAIRDYATLLRRKFLLHTWQPTTSATDGAAIAVLEDMVACFREAFDGDFARALLCADASIDAPPAAKSLSKDALATTTRNLSNEITQKALGAKIVALLLSNPKAAPANSYFGKIAESELIALCVEQIREREHAHEFWADVDNADLRMLALVAPRAWIARGVAKQLVETDPRDIAATIATEYRTAIAISGRPGQIDSIHAYVRFWFGLLHYGVAHVRDSTLISHWNTVLRAMDAADLPGLTQDWRESYLGTSASAPAGTAAAAPASRIANNAVASASAAKARSSRKAKTSTGAKRSIAPKASAAAEKPPAKAKKAGGKARAGKPRRRRDARK